VTKKPTDFSFVREVKPVVDYGVRALCARPYHGHPKGCPNYGKRACCPPCAPKIENTLDLSKPVFAIFNVFDFGSHVARMRAKHPNWTDRQCACCLYWQGTARKHLREKVAQVRGLRIISTPEAQGVNLTATMRTAGIELEWPPVKMAYQIVLAGTAPK